MFTESRVQSLEPALKSARTKQDLCVRAKAQLRCGQGSFV